MYKFINNLSRSGLIEGRQSGLAFGFAKKEGETITLISPLSPCKDYLNDVVYSEVTGNPYKIFGLATKRNGIFTPEGAFLVASVRKQGTSEESLYPDYQKDMDGLKSNAKALSEAANQIEQKIKIEGRTRVEPLGDNLVLLTLPPFWVAATYRISLITLIMRASLHWDGKGDWLDFVKKLEGGDKYLLNTAMPKLQKMMDGTIPEQDMSKVTSPHSQGIVGYQFK